MKVATATLPRTANSGLNLPVFIITAGFIALFCALALFDLDMPGGLVDGGFGWSAKVFGLYWQVLLPGTFVIGIVAAAVAVGCVSHHAAVGQTGAASGKL